MSEGARSSSATTSSESAPGTEAGSVAVARSRSDVNVRPTTEAS